ncbi:prion protein b [Nothobranchius furzeri]|uniref:Calcium-binding protein P-like n=3 Tax=Nothobranchius TaxID=28779 RepID=A0A1A8UC23_NOTFU|nr:prion protein b [Nothobranchius furzeri]KAF7217022.1 calcium-binding protein P-like [Nothobranchius furzeri]
MAMLGRLCEMGLLSLLILSLLNPDFTWAKKGGGSSGGRSKTSSSSKWGTQSKPSNSQPGNYPRQPQSPNNPYPAGGSYPHPGTGNTNPGGYPRQNPSYPNQNPGGYPAGGYPAGGGYPNQNPGRGNYPNQNPPAGGYPAGGGYPNQNPGRGGYPNQYPAGGYPNQYPAGGSYPNQYPARNFPNQYPAAGGYPNQYPPRGGGNPGGYPYQYPGGGYPVRTGNTGPGWGAPGANPGGYPGGGIGGYPNWNPNNKILSPRFGGGGYGYGGYGMGGSPFSRSVQSMGYQPKSTGFAKKAMLAAGVGAVAGMAVGYGLGRFPRPHFNFRNPEEEYYYNNYMYRRYGTQSTDEKDYRRDYEYKPPPRAESYESFMKRCMNSTEASSSPAPKSGAEEDDDTVSIEEIGYPALIDQVKSRRCVEKYMVYSEQFLQERKFEQQTQPSGSSPASFAVMQLFTSCFVLLSSMLLLQ